MTTKIDRQHSSAVITRSVKAIKRHCPGEQIIVPLIGLLACSPIYFDLIFFLNALQTFAHHDIASLNCNKVSAVLLAKWIV